MRARHHAQEWLLPTSSAGTSTPTGSHASTRSAPGRGTQVKLWAASVDAVRGPPRHAEDVLENPCLRIGPSYGTGPGPDVAGRAKYPRGRRGFRAQLYPSGDLLVNGECGATLCTAAGNERSTARTADAPSLAAFATHKPGPRPWTHTRGDVEWDLDPPSRHHAKRTG